MENEENTNTITGHFTARPTLEAVDALYFFLPGGDIVADKPAEVAADARGKNLRLPVLTVYDLPGHELRPRRPDKWWLGAEIIIERFVKSGVARLKTQTSIVIGRRYIKNLMPGIQSMALANIKKDRLT